MNQPVGIQNYIPQVSDKTIRRERLFRQLEASQKARLILVSAPAGYGKTVLLAHWFRSTALGCAWLTVEEKEPSLKLFWQQVIDTLRGIKPDIGSEALEALRQDSEISVESILTRLVAEIDRWGQSIYLVLDDYFHIQASPTHQSIRYLLEHCPENFHLVLITRVDPPLPLARYRLRGQMLDLRAEDMRLTKKETEQLLQGLGTPSISPNAMTLLHEQTEGWAAGIQLSALAIQKQRDPEAFISAFSGNLGTKFYGYIFDYLTEEVLANLADEQREFLLKTSILSQFNGPICEALVEHGNGQAILEQLYQQNIFLQAVDEAQEWFRYHGLFRDVLRYRLKRTYPPEEIKRLHQRASFCYQKAGWGQEALQHALAAEDFDRVGELFESMIELLTWSSGFHTDLIPTLEGLPENVIQSRPRLQLLYARALLLNGQPQEALRRLDDLEKRLGSLGLPEEERKHYTGMILTQRATHLALTGEVAQAKAFANQALENLPPNDLLTIAQAVHTLGLIADSEGQLRTAAGYFQQASTQAIRADHRSLAVTAACQQAFAEIGLGELRQAEETVQQAFQWAMVGSLELPVAAYAHVAMAEVLRHQHRLQQAEQEIRRAAHLAHKGMPMVQWHANLVQANICFSRRDLSGAESLLQQAESRFQYQLPGYFVELTRASLCRVWIAQKRLDLAESELAALEQRTFAQGISTLGSNQDAVALVVCQALISAGRKEAAREKLQAIYKSVVRLEKKALAIETLILLALSAEDSPSAQHYLQEAVVLAEPQGYQQVFLDEGKAIFDLLQILRRHLTSPSPFLKSLLDAFQQELITPIKSTPHFLADSEIEALTERELDVLAQIARGASNQAIANQLVVSVHTVKKHAANIFIKLGVENRTEAVVRAHSLGLL